MGGSEFCNAFPRALAFIRQLANPSHSGQAYPPTSCVSGNKVHCCRHAPIVDPYADSGGAMPALSMLLFLGPIAIAPTAGCDRSGKMAL